MSRQTRTQNAIWRQAEAQGCSGCATPLWRAIHGPEATRETRRAAYRWVDSCADVTADPVPAELRVFYR